MCSKINPVIDLSCDLHTVDETKENVFTSCILMYLQVFVLLVFYLKVT